ncbi:MAG: hypothetical protein L3J47_01885 [Sulfurovum sp.]|nr:hypothetical protein [Sulfurovum sp.]
MQSHYEAAQKVFEAIAQQYALRDPARLEEMIISWVDPKRGSTEQRQSRLGRKNGIISFQQFEALLTRYQFEADDPNAGRVPWRKYFTFHPAPKQAAENLIAGDYLSIELLSVLFGLDRAVVEEEWVESEGALKSLLQRYGIVYDKALFSEQFIDRSECEVQYDYQGERYGFSFVDIEGEVKDFAFDGKQ